MTISHHPLDETLAAYASGTLDAARQFVVAAHANSCARCRTSIAVMDEVGGSLLTTAEQATMAPVALQMALAMLDAMPQRDAASSDQTTLGENLMRQVLETPELGQWAWAGPGLRVRSLYLPPGEGARLFLLKAVPGLALPNHTHTGTEMTLVLRGAFAHSGSRFAAGDCDDADETDQHAPVVDSGETCVCLVAMEGQLKLGGLFGRLAQPFVRI